MHVLDPLHYLVCLLLHLRFGDIVLSPVNSVVEVAVHEFEDESESTRRLIIQYLMKFDDVWVRRQSLQRLDLSQVLNLFYRMEVVFHTLDGNVLPSFDRLTFEYLGEGSFSFLRYKRVF